MYNSSSFKPFETHSIPSKPIRAMERYNGTQTHSGHGTSTSNNPYLYGTALWKQFNDLLVEQFNEKEKKEQQEAKQEEMEETKRVDAILQERDDKIKAGLRAKHKHAFSKEKKLEEPSEMEEIKVSTVFETEGEGIHRFRSRMSQNSTFSNQQKKEEHDQWVEDIMRKSKKQRTSCPHEVD